MSGILWETLISSIGTAAFSVLFQVRPKHYAVCGLVGGLSWLMYRITTLYSHSTILATFVAALVVTLCSRWFATLRRTPTVIFLVCGILPLVPGSAIYYSAYYMFWERGVQSASYAGLTLKLGIAIALGILLAYSIPEKLFGWHYVPPKS